MTLRLNQRQQQIKELIEAFAMIIGINQPWAVAIAMAESSLGENQQSSTGCLGVFQMSSIAMQDLLESMKAKDDDLVDIVCGILFLRLLLKRWKTVEEATSHYCAPEDRPFYVDRVLKYMQTFQNSNDL